MKRGQSIAFLCLFFVASAIIGYFIAEIMIPAKEEPVTVIEPEPLPINTPEPAVDSAAVPKIASISAPQLRGGKYSFKVEAYVQSGDAIEIYLQDDKDVTVDTSDTGEFAGVDPIDTFYQVFARNVRTGQRSDVKLIFECKIPEVKLVDKVSAETLASMINKGDYSSTFSRTWIREHAPNCRFKYTGLNEEDLIPDGIADLCNRVNMEGWTCDVTYIDYNERNEIIKVTIHIVK